MLRLYLEAHWMEDDDANVFRTGTGLFLVSSPSVLVPSVYSTVGSSTVLANYKLLLECKLASYSYWSTS